MSTDTEQIFLIKFDKPTSTANNKDVTESLNLDSVNDFANVCRVCANVSEVVVPIFDGEGLQNNLADKINSYLPIQVWQEDTLPHVLCKACTQTVLSWHSLTLLAQQADAVLRERRKVLDTLQQQSKSGNNENGEILDGVLLDRSHLPQGPRHSFKPFDEDVASVHSDPDDEDDVPLASMSNKKTVGLFENFYRALLNFRDHFTNEHITKSTDIDSSSDSEAVDEENNEAVTEIDINDYDDLTQSNMRKDRMDDATRQELNEAQNRVNGKTYYRCKQCGKNLSTAHTYVYHVRIHTDSRPCVCHVCGKQFRAPHALTRHLAETHARLRRHPCPLCPRAFTNAHNLKQHARVHTGERPYVCNHCGKRFAQSGSLHAHRKTHADHFPHICAECGAKFRLRAGLVRHRLKHSGERPHACTLCQKTFRQRHELNAHAAMHAGRRPHACDACPAAYTQRRALREHTRRAHSTHDPPQPTQHMLYVQPY